MQDKSIDSTYIKAHKASARAAKKGECQSQNQLQNECIGVSRGGRSTKIHAVVDALGNPIHVQLSAGNVHDVTVAEELLSAVSIKDSMVLADKAYGAFRLRECIAAQQADYCIPPKSNESEPWFCDWWRYKERHLVECFFLKLKEFRRVATRYDKRACRYLGFVHLACIRILLA